MISLRYFAAACALAFAASAPAGDTHYRETFDGFAGDVPAQGLDHYPTMTIRYAGASTSGLRVNQQVAGRCIHSIDGYNLQGSKELERTDVTIAFKAPVTGILFGLCSPYPPREDVTVTFMGVDGTSLQTNVYKAGEYFSNVVQYSGNEPVANIVFHADKQLFIDNINHTLAN